MYDAYWYMWEMEREFARQQARRIELLSQQLDEARLVLYRHQWGGSGYCPECAGDMDVGHSKTCEWAGAMDRERHARALAGRSEPE